MKKLLSILIPCAFILALTSCSTNLVKDKDYNYVSKSHSYEYISTEELEKRADLIFVGKFTGETDQVVLKDESGKEKPDEVYTDHVMKTMKVIKGDVKENVNIRIFGGKLNDTIYVSRSGNPNLKNGKQYLIYLRKDDTAITKNGAECYRLICGASNCFEIDDSGNPIIDSKDDKDKQAIENMYKSAVNEIEE